MAPPPRGGFLCPTMEFYQLNNTASICILCESDKMVKNIFQYVQNSEIVIFKTGGSPKNQWTQQSYRRSKTNEYTWDKFHSREFLEYRIMVDDDGGGCKAAGVCFIAIVSKFPKAKIYECRVPFGSCGSSIGPILANFYEVARSVGGPHDNFDQLLQFWTGPAAEAPEENFDRSDVPSGCGLAYLKFLKTLMTEFNLEKTHFSFMHGRRWDIKREIFELLLREGVDHHLELSYISIVCMRQWRQKYQAVRSTMDSTVAEIIKELAHGSLKFIEEIDNTEAPVGQKNTLTGRNYFSYKLKLELYQLVFPRGLDSPPRIPLGMFTGTPNSTMYSKYQCPRRNPDLIMQYLFQKNSGENVQIPFNDYDLMVFTFQRTPEDVAALKKIWTIICPATHGLLPAAQTSVLRCCGETFGSFPEIHKHRTIKHVAVPPLSILGIPGHYNNTPSK